VFDILSVQIYTALDSFREKVLKHLREFYTNLHCELVRVPISFDSLSRVALHLMATAANRVSSDCIVEKNCKSTIFVLVLVLLTTLVSFILFPTFNLHFTSASIENLLVKYVV
jgi:hypothetical protein